MSRVILFLDIKVNHNRTHMSDNGLDARQFKKNVVVFVVTLTSESAVLFVALFIHT